MTKKSNVRARAAELQPRLSQAADRLNSKIAAFEEELSSLNLGVAATVRLFEDDTEPLGLDLEFRKHAGRWRLLVNHWDDGRDHADRAPLVGASRELRLDAVALFPKLLESLLAASEQELARIDASAASVDSLIASMKTGDS